jgi:hypothetical protein
MKVIVASNFCFDITQAGSIETAVPGVVVGAGRVALPSVGLEGIES